MDDTEQAALTAVTMRMAFVVLVSERRSIRGSSWLPLMQMGHPVCLEGTYSWQLTGRPPAFLSCCLGDGQKADFVITQDSESIHAATRH